jgi:AcrR family transcriptional regulator
LSSTSRKTIERILECAQNELVAGGYAGFTMRHVAEAAGISPGHLAYHYPTKQDLLHAMVRQIITELSRQFSALLSNPDLSYSRGLEQFVRQLLTDSITENIVRTFRELWVISLHDEVVCNAVDDLYDALMGSVVELLQRSLPDADPRAIRESIQLLALVSEGSAVLYGTRQARAVPHERIIEIVIKVIDSLINPT